MLHRTFIVVHLAVLLALAFHSFAIPQPQPHLLHPHLLHHPHHHHHHRPPRPPPRLHYELSRFVPLIAHVSSSLRSIFFTPLSIYVTRRKTKTSITNTFLTTTNLTAIFDCINSIITNSLFPSLTPSVFAANRALASPSPSPSNSPPVSPAPCADPSTSDSDDDVNTDITVPDLAFYQNFSHPSDLYNKWDRLARDYDPIIQLSTIGISVEGRPIRALVLGGYTNRQLYHKSSSNIPPSRKRDARHAVKFLRQVTSTHAFESDDIINDLNEHLTVDESEKISDLPVVFLNAALHAREWITPMAATYVVEKLAVRIQRAVATNSDSLLDKVQNDNGKSEPSKDSIADVLSRVRVLVVPLSNPDGYTYSWETNPNWRKNRHPDGGCPQPRQDGVDLNRNWGKFYNGSYSTSMDPCDDVYIGSGAFSEPETSALRDLIQQHRVVAHLDVHSYGQLILGPWSASDELPPTASAIDSVGTGLAAAMSVPHGAQYAFARGATGAAELKQYAASGVMSDWVYSEGIMSFTVELRPETNIRDPDDGFRPPPHMILAASAELFAATRCLLAYADDPGTFGCRLNCTSSRGRQIPPAIPMYGVALMAVAAVVVLVIVVSIASLATMAHVRARQRRAALIQAFAGDGCFQFPKAPKAATTEGDVVAGTENGTETETAPVATSRGMCEGDNGDMVKNGEENSNDGEDDKDKDRDTDDIGRGEDKVNNEGIRGGR